MNSHTKKTKETLTTLTKDIKEDLNLNTDNEDVGNEEISDLSDEGVDNKVKEVEKTSEVPPPLREPRPLFLGHPDKKRRNRGSRKSKKNSNASTDGLKASQMGKPNEMQNENNPESSVTDVNMETSLIEAQAAYKESVDESIDSEPATPANKKTEKIASSPSKTSDKNPKAKPITIDDLIDKYGIPSHGTDHESQPWNNMRTLNSRNASKQQKRPRSNKNSPENASKRHRTYADVLTDDLILFITDKTSDIDENKSGLLEKKLMEKFYEFLSTNPKVAPTYHSSSIRYGNLKLMCTDRFSVEWFTRVINELPPPWEGASLEITTAEARKRNPKEMKPKPPKRPSVRFFIPDGMLKPDFNTVIKALKAQNPPLNTDDWTTWKQEEQDYGTFYHVSVKDEDVEFINGKEGRLFFCFHKIKIITPKQSKGETKVGKVMVNDTNN